MKGRKKSRLLALMMSFVLTVMVGLSVKAASDPGFKYTEIPGTTTSFNKYLVVRADETNPAVTFSFTVSAPDADIPSGSGTLEVKKGVDPDKVVIADVSFSDGEASTDKSSFDGDASVITFSDYTYAKKSVTVDLTAVKFTEPGVYRYYIREDDSTNPAFGNDTVPYRTLDVYIEDNSGTLTVVGYVMYKDQITAAPKTDATGDVTDVPNGAEAGTKYNLYTNTYPTESITLKKTVAGNQGSKDKYFKFTVKVEGTSIVSAADYAVSGQDKTTDIKENAATTYTKTEMATNDVDSVTGAQLTAGYTFYLQNDDTVVISGIPKGSTYTITEDSTGAAGYTITTKTDNVDSTDSTNPNIVTDTFDDSTVIEYTNTKSGVIPTGVLLSATPWIILGIVLIAGIVFFAVRSKKKYEEE